MLPNCQLVHSQGLFPIHPWESSLKLKAQSSIRQLADKSKN